MVKNTAYQFISSNLGIDIFLKRGNIRERVHWNIRLRLLCTLCIGVSRKFHLHSIYAYVLAKILQNGAKFIQKLTPGFKNFDNFSGKSKKLNLMGYFCQKNTYLKPKHYIHRIYLTLVSITCVKIHQITYVIFGTKVIFHDTTPLYSFSSRANFQTFHCSR